MKKKEDLRIVKTKMSLYLGLLSLMKNNKIETIKVSDICKASSINRSTFYDHFRDKYEVIDSLINDLKDALIENLKIKKHTDNIKDYLIALADILINEIDKKKDMFPCIIKNNNVFSRDMLTNATTSTVVSHIEENYINTSQFDTKVLVSFYVSGIVNTIINSINNGTYNKNLLLDYFKLVIPDEINYFTKKV